MENILIGYRKFKSKKGSDCCIVNFVHDFSSFDISHGAYGQTVEEVFLPEDCHGSITPAVIGSLCELVYGAGMYGKPAVTGIKFLNNGGK